MLINIIYLCTLILQPSTIGNCETYYSIIPDYTLSKLRVKKVPNTKKCTPKIYAEVGTFAGIPFTEGIGLALEVEAILKDECPGATLAQKSLRWILDHPAISTVIPGAKNEDQAKENAAAAELPPISKEAHDQLTALYDEKIDHQVRGVY